MAISCVHHLIRAFLSPCQSREAGAKPAPGPGFVMRSCCNRSHTVGHLDVTGSKSSTEGVGSTHWEQWADNGTRKRDGHPFWLAGPCAEVPFCQFNLYCGGTVTSLDIGEDWSNVALLCVLCSQKSKRALSKHVLFFLCFFQLLQSSWSHWCNTQWHTSAR